MDGIIDTHCHYNLDPLLSDWQRYWADAQAAGVTGSVVVGTDRHTSLQAVELANSNKYFSAAVGYHPHEAEQLSLEEIPSKVRQLVDECRQRGAIAAIGETGLDYFRLPDDSSAATQQIEKQKISLLAHLESATELQLPVILHVRDQKDVAYQDILNSLKPFGSTLTVVLHCFSGPEWYHQAAVAAGYYVSFAGNLTYPSAELLRIHAQKTPLDKLLVETDAPYLPPQSHRGQTCQPAYIMETTAALCEISGVSQEQLRENARRVFTTMNAPL